MIPYFGENIFYSSNWKTRTKSKATFLIFSSFYPLVHIDYNFQHGFQRIGLLFHD